MSRIAILSLNLALLASPLASQTPAAGKTAKVGAPSKGTTMITTPSGLQYLDLVEGAGPSPSKGQTCTMHYTGWLSDGGKPGKKFDSSVDRGQPFSFTLGVHQVIAGWDEGVATMKAGGKRTLHIPSALGYGTRGAGGVIPANADLIFDVELISFK